MFTNPFAELSASVPPGVMQTYVLIMILFVVGGTLFDVLHKKSAKYFFDNWRKVQKSGTHEVSSGEIASLAVKTAASEVLTSSEFCNQHRRIAHLLGMYGFVAFVVSTVVMVFGYPTPEVPTPGLWRFLWTLGALMVCGGGYWFWFFIRADVSAEGQSPFRLIRADLFILSLLGTATFGLLWSWTGPGGGGAWNVIFLILLLISATVLFGGVPWSKFSHMFFKPAAALQKRVEEANGTRSNLPAPANKPAELGNPRRLPSHY